jgi:hypothetical protein
MSAKKPARSKSKSSGEKHSKKRREARLSVTSEEARKAPARIYTGDNDDTADLEVQR